MATLQVGTIGIRAGVPADVDPWGWSCGFYPRSHRLEHHDGTAETFEQARADFEAAWRDYRPGCTTADFAEYRPAARLDSLEICDVGCRPAAANSIERRRC